MASIIVCILMFFEVALFVILRNNLAPAAIIYGAFLFFIFVKMTFAEKKKPGSGVIYRRLCQSIFAVGFCIAFIADLYAERGSMSITSSAMSNAELPFCHIAIPQVLVPLILTKNIIFPARIAGDYAVVASMLLIWLVCTLTVGRGWCSWICFYGGWEEGFSHVGKKRRINLLPKNREVRDFHFGFFFFILLASLCELACIYCDWFCPFKLVTEFSPINSIPSLIAAVMFIGLFLGLVVVLPILTKKRTQCSSLCPFGAFASLTDRFSMFKIKIDTEKCTGCLKCAMTCPFSAIDIKTIQEKKGHPELTCAKCGECVGVCPQKAISYDFRFSLKHECGTGCGSKKVPRTKAGRVLQDLLAPAMLFRYAAYTFFVIMSSGFMIKSLNLIAGAAAKLFMGGAQ